MLINKVNKFQHLIKYGIMVVGILFIFLGIYRDEARIVFTKAINICLECIGIG